MGMGQRVKTCQFVLPTCPLAHLPQTSPPEWSHGSHGTWQSPWPWPWPRHAAVRPRLSVSSAPPAPPHGVPGHDPGDAPAWRGVENGG